MNFIPTPEQQAFINYRGKAAFVKACPGSGKTRTIVERLKAKSRSSRRGVGVLSFTNSAVEEFKHRCAREDLLDNLKFPNFIGTFDSFIWKFIAIPAMQSSKAITPRLIESWDEIFINLRGDKAIKDKGIPLSRFDPIAKAYNTRGLSDNVTQTIARYSNDYIQEAERRLRSLNHKGFYSTSDARKIALENLTINTFKTSLGEALKGRFDEIIIDEAQDCNATDISILEWLFSSEIPIILVCDPGQAIYEFRNAKPDLLKEFTQNLDPLPLSGNFRSSPNICNFSAILRADNQPDTPLGIYKETEEFIRLLPYRGKTVCSSVGIRFLDVAKASGLSQDNIISLAHDRKSSMRGGGIIPPIDKEKTGKRYRLAQIVSMFNNSGKQVKAKEKALIMMLRMILEIEVAVENAETKSWKEIIEENDIEEREIKRRAIGIIGVLPGSCLENETDDWIKKAKKLLADNIKIPQNQTIDSLFRSSSDWHIPLTTLSQNNQILNYATVHEAKGSEYHGVLISIPPHSDVLRQCINQDFSEAVRVLYVGCTRAQKLLTIAIPQSKLMEFKDHLKNCNIPFTIISTE